MVDIDLSDLRGESVKDVLSQVVDVMLSASLPSSYVKKFFFLLSHLRATCPFFPFFLLLALSDMSSTQRWKQARLHPYPPRPQ